MRRVAGAALVVVACALMAWVVWPRGGGAVQAAAKGDAACASCHRAIYERYETTPMAQGSGVAVDGLLLGGFHHEFSGVDYKVFRRDGRAWMSYARESAKEPLSGERELRYYVGSGHRGRTYLYEESGLWFEAPINYYSKKAVWDMAPAYERSRTMPDGLPVDPNCLYCHATGVAASVGGARNRFAGQPFAQGGIGCASCHGDASAHVASGGKAAVLNPAKLMPAARDSVCLQCHLEGDAAIYKAGRSLATFVPGENLADSVTYFVKASAVAGGGRAASQWEALLRSRCKIASGDKMTCTTCHDPHGSPTEAERVGYFRAKCLSCHSDRKIAVEHHPEQPDCALCHMPTRKTADISHEQTVDHDIRKRPGSPAEGGLRLASLGESANTLVPVGMATAGDREFGLAYAQVAQGGDPEARSMALQMLQKAEAAGANDAELHAQLGLMEQLAGQLGKAHEEYDRALALDPNDGTALGNEAVLEASAGRTAAAVVLLRRVVKNDPAQVAAGLNLAFIECAVGQKQQAAERLATVRRFSPDDPLLRRFLATGEYAGQRCDVSAAGKSGR
jgi:predicted CXXCH cytochrome family protein